MSALAAVMVAHFRNSYRLRAPVIVMISVCLLMIAGMTALCCLFAIAPAMRPPAPDAAQVGRYVSLLVYATALLVMGLNLNFFTANNLVKEKAQRLVESVLAGPVGVRTLWIGKSLAVFLPGLVLGEVSAIAVFLGVEALFVAPRMGYLVTPLMVANGLALAPLLYLPMSALVLLVGLTGSPVSGNVIANIVFSALLTLVINVAVRAGLDVGSLPFAAAHVGMSALVAILVLVLQRGLSKERVVLSGRT